MWKLISRQDRLNKNFYKFAFVVGFDYIISFVYKTNLLLRNLNRKQYYIMDFLNEESG